MRNSAIPIPPKTHWPMGWSTKGKENHKWVKENLCHNKTMQKWNGLVQN